MKYTYDPFVDALSIRIKSGRITETREVTPYLNIDLDGRGRILAIEVLDAKKHFGRINLQGVSFSVLPYSKREIRRLAGVK